MPEWITVLNKEHYLKKMYIEKIKESVVSINKIRDVDTITDYFSGCEYIDRAYLSEVDPSTGEITINLSAPQDYIIKY